MQRQHDADPQTWTRDLEVIASTNVLKIEIYVILSPKFALKVYINHNELGMHYGTLKIQILLSSFYGENIKLR